MRMQEQWNRNVIYSDAYIKDLLSHTEEYEVIFAVLRRNNAETINLFLALINGMC